VLLSYGAWFDSPLFAFYVCRKAFQIADAYGLVDIFSRTGILTRAEADPTADCRKWHAFSYKFYRFSEPALLE
jgi:hypothetical protein